MIFGNAPKRITKKEFSQAIVRAKGISNEEQSDLWLIFAGDMDESGRLAGIDATELERRIQWMRENQSKHRLDGAEIDSLQIELKKFL